MPPQTYESSRGKYHVLAIGNNVLVEARKEDSPFYIKQSVLIENIEDLKDLFVTIASVLNQAYATDQFK
jgi:hypothetical protein